MAYYYGFIHISMNVYVPICFSQVGEFGWPFFKLVAYFSPEERVYLTFA